MFRRILHGAKIVTLLCNCHILDILVTQSKLRISDVLWIHEILISYLFKQGSTENIPNPVYARIIQIHRPKIGEDGNVILNDQAKHVDVTCEVEDFEDQNMQDCYDGIETVTVDLQARNVFCGAYNVLVLNNV